MRRSVFLPLLAAVIVAVGLLEVAPPKVGEPSRPAAVSTSAGASRGAARAASDAGAGSAAEVLTIVCPANAAALSALLPAPTRQVNYVRVDRTQIEAKRSPFWQPHGNGRVHLPLANGRAITVVIDGSEMLGADRFTSTGHVEGARASRAVFAYNHGFLSATIETAEHEYALRPATESVAQWYEVDPALVPPCGGVRHPQIDPAVIAAAAARKARQADMGGASSSTAATTAAAEAGQHPVVDVMMLYTQAVKPTLSGDARVAALQSEFDAAVAKVNNELAASQITARVRLVKIAQTQYDETASASNKVQDDALTALYETSDGKMDEIHVLRDQVGADVVCLALNRSDSASIGLSFVLDTPASVDASAGATNPFYAFAVVQYGMIAGTDVVPHELGHVLGCAHARNDPGTTGSKDGAYTYSYGYRFYGTDGRQYHDIMAYSPGTPLSYYSNPDLTAPSPISAPLGVAPGQTGEADCALTIEKDAFEVASYRLQTPAASAGTLVNVSTRAFIGSGDQVLIGGFVIDGSAPKRVLVRAPGPVLAGYGVANAITHPVISVHSGNTIVGTDDGWGNQPTAADVAAAATQVSAFPFPTGSADSAVLLTLNPGAYSAVVAGGGGATGSGMVEVYDVDRTGNKIINLSTRGYADIGKEMIGGFVVQGAAGTTKRILIRALGPTLARAPFNVTGAMNDPILELHDAAGNLLLKNDDWSSNDTAGTFNATNDFSPAVTTYSEQQIAATGYAPANRREPGVMLDLPPGNYSVIVRPFEDLTTTPPQPAAPGVVIVEVYEITP